MVYVGIGNMTVFNPNGGLKHVEGPGLADDLIHIGSRFEWPLVFCALLTLVTDALCEVGIGLFDCKTCKSSVWLFMSTLK